jgi:RNA 2',3'-cyclic 3'-phosphodiesterase
MRLFVALDINDDIRNRIARYLEGVRGFAPAVRWMRSESLHLTLKFIGETPEQDIERTKQTLATIAADEIEIRFCGYGFFPGVREPRVFWIGIEAGSKLTSLAAIVDAKLALLGIPKEQYAFSPHLTLARGPRGSGSPRRHERDGPNRAFQSLQEKLAALPAPEFGTMTAHEFFLYQSQLSPGGSKYTKLAGFALLQRAI